MSVPNPASYFLNDLPDASALIAMVENDMIAVEQSEGHVTARLNMYDLRRLLEVLLTYERVRSSILAIRKYGDEIEERTRKIEGLMKEMSCPKVCLPHPEEEA